MQNNERSMKEVHYFYKKANIKDARDSDNSIIDDY